jgi:hypothetical protein
MHGWAESTLVMDLIRITAGNVLYNLRFKHASNNNGVIIMFLFVIENDIKYLKHWPTNRSKIIDID